MNTAMIPLCLVNITSHSSTDYQELTTGIEEIEFKDTIGRELDTSSQKTCSCSLDTGWLQCFQLQQSPNGCRQVWLQVTRYGYRQVEAKHLGMTPHLPPACLGEHQQTQGASFMQDMLQFLGFSTEKEQAPVLTMEPST